MDWLPFARPAAAAARRLPERLGAAESLPRPREGKIRLGISACLLGEKVRYDGGDKRDDLLIGALGPSVEFVPVCPEVEAGLGVPRAPMRLAGDPAAPDVTIDGHADTKRVRAYNDRLSLSRAKAVAELLAARGANAAAFKVIALGQSALPVPTGEQADEPRKRRVEITVR